MIIPEIDQQLASIKAASIQYDNGYHLSDADYQQLADAMTHLTYLYHQITAQRRKEGKQIITNGVTPWQQ